MQKLTFADVPLTPSPKGGPLYDNHIYIVKTNDSRTAQELDGTECYETAGKPDGINVWSAGICSKGHSDILEQENKLYENKKLCSDDTVTSHVEVNSSKEKCPNPNHVAIGIHVRLSQDDRFSCAFAGMWAEPIRLLRKCHTLTVVYVSSAMKL